MAPKAKRRKKNKRVKRTPKKYKNKKLSLAKLPLNGWPETKLARHRYTDTFAITFTPSAQVSKSFQIVANGMFDPIAAAGGHQPKGFDEMMAIYDHYYVLGSMAKVRCMPGNLDSNKSIAWGVKVTDERSSLGYGPLSDLAWTDILETKGARPNVVHSNSANGSFGNTGRLFASCKYSPRRIHGPGFATDSTNRGNAAANPQEKSYFEIWVCPHASSTSTNAQEVWFTVTVDYLVRYAERQHLRQS